MKWATPTGGGKVLQVVQSTYSTNTVSSSTSYIDVGLSVNITPSSATSKIFVIHNGTVYLDAAGNKDSSVRLVRDATTISEQIGNVGSSTSSSIIAGISFGYLDSPATTSALTYKVQAKVNSGTTMYYLHNNSMGTITVMEIGA